MQVFLSTEDITEMLSYQQNDASVRFTYQSSEFVYHRLEPMKTVSSRIRKQSLLPPSTDVVVFLKDTCCSIIIV